MGFMGIHEDLAKEWKKLRDAGLAPADALRRLHRQRRSDGLDVFWVTLMNIIAEAESISRIQVGDLFDECIPSDEF